MKGIFKPLRYFSQIFDGKEQEMQIGFPTDVKHVAHIGWDGPSVTSPGWMSDFKSAPLDTFGSEPLGDGAEPKVSSHSHDLSLGAEVPQRSEKPEPVPDPKPSRRKQPTSESPSEGCSRGGSESPAPKPSRRHASVGGLTVDAPASSSPGPPPPRAPRHSRRNKSAEGAFANAGGQDPSEGSSTRRGRRSNRVSKEGGNDPDLPVIPKQTKKKKKKSRAGSCSDESSSSIKSEATTTEVHVAEPQAAEAEKAAKSVETPIAEEEVKVCELRGNELREDL